MLRERLAAQLLGAHRLRTPAEVVAWMGAIQAQDLGASRWAVGARLPGSTDAEVHAAISTGEVLRTHLLRGTWQLVARADLRWMLALVAPRVLSAREAREASLGLDARLFRKARAVLERALAGRVHRTRAELAARLAQDGIRTDGTLLSYLLGRAELMGVVCSGPLRDGTITFALLDERVPARPAPLGRAEGLRELALRHARGRGPVAERDLSWWAGIGRREAREALEAARPAVVPERWGGELLWRATDAWRPARGGAHLLPAFDEYLVGYRDRSAMLDPDHVKRINAGGGLLAPCFSVDGTILGVWTRAPSGRSFAIELAPFERLSAKAHAAIGAAARRYAAFLGKALRRDAGLLAPGHSTPHQ